MSLPQGLSQKAAFHVCDHGMQSHLKAHLGEDGLEGSVTGFSVSPAVAKVSISFLDTFKMWSLIF